MARKRDRLRSIQRDLHSLAAHVAMIRAAGGATGRADVPPGLVAAACSPAHGGSVVTLEACGRTVFAVVGADSPDCDPADWWAAIQRVAAGAP